MKGNGWEQIRCFLKNPVVIQFVKFGLVGVLNSLVSLIVYYLFIWVSPEMYLIGSIVGALVSIANSFYWNNKYVFSSKKNGALDILKRLGKTYLSYGATSLLSIALLYIEVDVLELSAVLCPLANYLITVPLNFFLNKFWTFRQMKR